MVFSQEIRYKVLSAVDWTLVSFSKSQDVKKNKNICIIGDVRTFSHALQGNTHTHAHTRRDLCWKNKNLYLHWKNLEGAAERAPARSSCCPARAAACFLAADTQCSRVSSLMKSRWWQPYWSVTEDSGSAAPAVQTLNRPHILSHYSPPKGSSSYSAENIL